MVSSRKTSCHKSHTFKGLDNGCYLENGMPDVTVISVLPIFIKIMSFYFPIFRIYQQVNYFLLSLFNTFVVL